MKAGPCSWCLAAVPIGGGTTHAQTATTPQTQLRGLVGVPVAVVDGLSMQSAQCVVGEVEIVAFDNSQEYLGGIFELSASAVPSVSVPEGESAV